jgi:hypothetical protein
MGNLAMKEDATEKWQDGARTITICVTKKVNEE